MSEPTKPADKAALLATIQAGYNQFEALLASLPENEMTVPGVNDGWSIKDHLAHLAAWQNYQAARLQGILDGVEPPDPLPGHESVDELNEYFYQQYKDRSLAEVLAEFRASYQRILSATQALSWEALNRPFPWYNNDVPAGAYTLGNTAEHYEEHSGWIQRWLESRK